LSAFNNEICKDVRLNVATADRSKQMMVWTKLCSFLICTQRCYDNHIKKDEARIDESRNAYKIFVGKGEMQRPLGEPWRRWEDNIRMDLREMG